MDRAIGRKLTRDHYSYLRLNYARNGVKHKFRKYFEHKIGCAIELLVRNEDLGGMKGDTGVWLALLVE